MRISIFTDCFDQNAIIRQTYRYESLFPEAEINFKELNSLNFVPVLAGAIDEVDAVRFSSGVNIFVFNLAQRTEKKYENGQPFCFTRLGSSIIIGTISSFSVLKKLGIVKSVYVTEIEKVCLQFLSVKEAKRISQSQFRSYDFVPLLALWIYQGHNIKSTNIELNKTELSDQIWFIDCFGNCKTTIPGTRFSRKANGYIVSTNFGDLPFFQRLSDVPVDTVAIIIGSSGYRSRRFIEIIKNGGSAQKELGIELGDNIKFV
jgi:hypothetical protein